MEEKNYEGTPVSTADTEPLEQPQSIDTHTADAEESKGGQSILEGSEIGKFKSVQDLLNAYNNLQSEFTRKCQKLSELQKSVCTSTENVANVANFGLVNNNENANNDGILKPQSNSIIETDIVAKTSEVPQMKYATEDWQEIVDDFIIKNPEAKNYAKDISTLILKDKIVAESSNPLELAWAKVLSMHYKEPSAICNDEEFVNKYILTNENIRQKVLMDYLQQVSEQKSPPLIVKSLGSGLIQSKTNKPKNFKEAAYLAEAMLKS
ncbi:MAG: hypothetical protein WCX32_02105 [Clostridia bacterium]|jgi:hypothetical protein|nr:hypothetical protein [Clostridia bacterium]